MPDIRRLRRIANRIRRKGNRVGVISENRRAIRANRDPFTNVLGLQSLAIAFIEVIVLRASFGQPLI